MSNIDLKRRTKIVATIGPATQSEEIITDLIKAGVTTFRLNFSHGDHKDHAERIKTIRDVSKKFDIDIGILQDLQGPKIRLGRFKEGPVKVKKGDKFLLRKTILEKRPPRTAHKTDKKGKAKILKLFVSEKEEFFSLKSLLFLRIMNSEIVTMIIPTHDLVVKFSLIKNSPDKAAINGERVSIDKVFLVPIVCSDFK